MTSKELKGVLALTPLVLTEKQEIDYEGIKSNVQLLAKNKVHGFVAFGSMGQHYAPTIEEFNKVVDTTMDAANANQICVIGSTAPNTKEAVRRTRYAEDAGADGVMLAVPYAFPVTPRMAFEHYRLADNSIRGELAIMVYNWGQYGINITPELWDDLLKLEHIKAVKESESDIVHRNRILLKLHDKINVLAGNEEWFYNDSMLGSKGIVGISVWCAPKLIMRYYEECLNGNQLKPWTLNAYHTMIKRGPGRGIDLSINTRSYGAAILNVLVEAGGGRAGPPALPYERLPKRDLAAIDEYVRELNSIPVPERSPPIVTSVKR